MRRARLSVKTERTQLRNWRQFRRNKSKVHTEEIRINTNYILSCFHYDSGKKVQYPEPGSVGNKMNKFCILGTDIISMQSGDCSIFSQSQIANLKGGEW